jgi:LTXXQ motif family protein
MQRADCVSTTPALVFASAGRWHRRCSSSQEVSTMRLGLWGLLIGAAIWGCAHASHRWGYWTHHRHDRWCRHDRPHDGLAAWLERTHRRLDITPDQEPAWDRFADAVTDAAALFDDPARCDDAARTAPAAMERLAGLTRAADETMARLRPAFDALYAELSDAQRRLIDRMMGGRWV